MHFCGTARRWWRELMHEMSETDEEHKLSRLTVILSNTIVHFDKVRMMSRGPWSGLIGHLIDRGHGRSVSSMRNVSTNSLCF